MAKKEALQLFEQKKVRTVWDDQEEKWYFSIVDVCDVLTDSPNPRNYWKVLKHRLVKEGNETVTNCNQLKLVSQKETTLQTVTICHGLKLHAIESQSRPYTIGESIGTLCRIAFKSQRLFAS